MKIASWNVNSLRVRLPQVLEWLEDNQVDVLALQETKMVDEDFPVEEIQQAGYEVQYSGQKTYNGVAILSKQEGSDVVKDIKDLDDPQRRILAATVDDVRVLNLYVVNGKEVGSDKYEYKLDWLKKVTAFIKQDLKKYPRYVVLGDFNIAPEDADVHSPEAWRDKILCSDEERQALATITDLGFVDTFRLFDQEENTFSWWDYRGGGFRRNQGLRIDLILASSLLEGACSFSVVDKAPRANERPSDHAPVIAEFM
ncbi:MAG: exodeoxyribonuclease III [Gammaproteobacteria bacterium]